MKRLFLCGCVIATLITTACTGGKTPVGASTDETDSTAVGEVVTPEESDEISLEGIAKVIKGATMLTPFVEGRASVVKDNKLGVIDRQGHVIVPFEYDYSVMTYSEGILCCHKGEKRFYLDRDGKVLFTMDDSSPGEFHDGLAMVWKDGANGFINKKGETVIPFEWEFALDFSDGLAIVYKDGLYGFIDTTGKLVIPCQYETPAERNPEGFSEGIAAVIMDSSNEKFGFIDKTGKQVFSKLYYNDAQFSEGLADVFDNEVDRYVYIDKTGKTVITLDENWNGDSFHEGLALTRGPQEMAYIDKTGKKIFTIDYQQADRFSEGLARVGDGKKNGFIDKTGKLVIPFKYVCYSHFSDGLVVVRNGDQEGYMDKEGHTTFDFQ